MNECITGGLWTPRDADCSSAVVRVPKPGGKDRERVDRRLLNKVTRVPAQRVPRIQQAFDACREEPSFRYSAFPMHMAD